MATRSRVFEPPRSVPRAGQRNARRAVGAAPGVSALRRKCPAGRGGIPQSGPLVVGRGSRSAHMRTLGNMLGHSGCLASRPQPGVGGRPGMSVAVPILYAATRVGDTRGRRACSGRFARGNAPRDPGELPGLGRASIRAPDQVGDALLRPCDLRLPFPGAGRSPAHGRAPARAPMPSPSRIPRGSKREALLARRTIGKRRSLSDYRAVVATGWAAQSRNHGDGDGHCSQGDETIERAIDRRARAAQRCRGPKIHDPESMPGGAPMRLASEAAARVARKAS